MGRGLGECIGLQREWSHQRGHGAFQETPAAIYGLLNSPLYPVWPCLVSHLYRKDHIKSYYLQEKFS